MSPRLVLSLLSQRARQASNHGGAQTETSGFSMAAALLVAIALSFGTLAVASFFSGALLSSRSQNARNDAIATAEAGMNRAMSSFNEPVNRKFLVSGQAMQNWATADLTSPCRDTKNNSPGSPTTEARNYGDGQFRSLDTLDVNKGSRQFRITKVTYSAGLADQADRRSQSITTTPGTGSLTTVNNYKSELINLDRPADATKNPGYNKGYFTVTVEAKVIEGGKTSTATLTREYEVLPRCCGASFGSNGSGGSTLNNTASLGADSRFCGVEFGMILGLNGGTAWQNLANDRYTKRLTSGSVVPISNIIGIVTQDGDSFNRATGRMRPNASSTTIPDPCDPARWTGGVSCSGTSWTGLKSATPGGNYGTQSDIDGSALSGIPITPSALTLPTIGSESVTGKYNFSWTSNSGPSNRVSTSSTGGGNRYPVLNPAGVSGYKFRFRTRSQAVTGFATAPVVEVCNESATTLGGSGGCTTAANWTSISSNVSPVDSIETFSTITAGSTWTNGTALSAPWIDQASGSDWFEIDTNAASTASNTGRVRLVGSGATANLQIGVGGTMSALQNGICRAVNLSGNLGRGMLSFDQSGSNVSSTDAVWVQVSTSGASNAACNSPGDTTGNGSNISTQWITIAKFPGVTTTTRRIVSLADYQANPLRVRIINGTTTNATRIHIIDNINASTSDWCQYSASSPATLAPGFHCLGPHFNLTVNSTIWTSAQAGGQVYIDASGGPITFYYTRTDDLRGNSYTYINPLNLANPLIAVDYGGFIRLVKCSGSPTTNCTTPIAETDVALVGDPDNLNFFGRDTGSEQVVYFGVVNDPTTGTGKISGVWFYMPVGYFELKAYGCSGYNPSGTAPDISLDDGWILNGRIWTQHFKPCGDIHIRVPPSSASNLGQVAAASQLFSDVITYVPWTGTDWVARAVTQSRSY